MKDSALSNRHAALSGHSLALRGLMVMMVAAPAAAQTTFPAETWPSNQAIANLNGATDEPTGLTYILKGTNSQSSPPYQIQYDRRLYRQNLILRPLAGLRVAQTGAATIGVYPGHFRISGVDHWFGGADGISVPTSNDTYYVYLESDGDGGGTVSVVSSGDGWPEDVTTFIPLAEITVSSAAIASIEDVRGRVMFATRSGGGDSATGVDSTFFILDQDNADAGVSAEYRVNRGSTDDDAAIRWDETSDLWAFLLDTVNNVFAPIKALSLELTATTGTAPLTVSSATKVDVLNVDQVDGLDFTAPAAAYGVAYADDVDSVTFTDAPTAGDVLVADGSGVPTWAAPGIPSGVQAHDADLDAIAAVSSAGLLARTGAGTAAARTITAGESIAVTNGDGASGNPTIAVSGMTERGVVIGTPTGGITSITPGVNGTVLAGRTGNTPIFRSIVESDIDTSARIELSKLARGTSAQMIVADSSGVPTYRTISGDVSMNASGVASIAAPPAISIDSVSGNTAVVSIQIRDPNGANVSANCLFRVWISDAAGGMPTSSAPSAAGPGGGAFRTYTSDIEWDVITGDDGKVSLAIAVGSARTLYVNCVWLGRVYSSEAVVFDF